MLNSPLALENTASAAINYVAPWWLPDGNLQTIWPALRSPGGAPRLHRERWTTPDADFIDVDRLAASHDASPLLVLFHGLEGSSASHYALALACYAQARGLAFAVPHFRGCSGEMNLAPRAYHSGDYEEIGWILRRLRQQHAGPLIAVGVSLGGNALLRWAQEAGDNAGSIAVAVAAVSAPLDLAASGQAIGQGFNRWVYTRRFLQTMRPRALRKLEQYPGLFDRQALLAARTLYAFDNAFTAPVHGFRDTEDYWARCSARPRMRDIAPPTLVLNARNDPFVPASSLPAPHEVSPHVTLWQPLEGGHVGFPTSASTEPVLAKVVDWLLQFTEHAHG